MNKYISLFYISLAFFCSSCQSDDPGDEPRTCLPSTDGTIQATINGTAWTACEFDAVYYRYDHMLSFSAVDQNSRQELRFNISVDSLAPLKAYAINSNSNNGLMIVEPTESSSYAYQSDYLKTGIGATFTLTNFDTISGRLSASFSGTGLDYEANKTITVENGIAGNVKMQTSDSSQTSWAYMRGKINGVKWYSQQVGAMVTLHIGSPLYSFLQVETTGSPMDLQVAKTYIDRNQLFGGGGRGFTFFLPLALSPGTYPLGGYGLYQQTIADQRFLFRIIEHQDDPDRYPVYYPQPGSTFTLVSLDTAGRHLEARFSLQAKSAEGGIYNITEGELFLPYWRKMFEH